MLRVDERDLAAALLRLRHDMQRQRGLAGRFRAVDLNDPPLRHAADAERGVERQRAGRDGVDLQIRAVAQAHDRALAEVFLDLPDGGIERLFLVVIGSLIGCFFSFHRLSSFLLVFTNTIPQCSNKIKRLFYFFVPRAARITPRRSLRRAISV